MKPDIIAPAPWLLEGKGIVMLYPFPGSFSRQYGFLESYQFKAFKGGIGAVMLVDYLSSDVGPYRELLFIPGLFRLGGRLSFSISRIYVSSFDSLWNGQKNWGIPKELADFQLKEQVDGSRFWKVQKEGKTFLEASIQPKSTSFPVNSRLLPLSRISQQEKNQLLLTSPKVRGKARFATLQHIQADSEYFPPLHLLKPLITLSLQEFLMTFPPAQKIR